MNTGSSCCGGFIIRLFFLNILFFVCGMLGVLNASQGVIPLRPLGVWLVTAVIGGRFVLMTSLLFWIIVFGCLTVWLSPVAVDGRLVVVLCWLNNWRV